MPYALHLRGAIAAFAMPVLAIAGALLPSVQAHAESEVNIYSYREPGLIDPILKRFSEETGIKVNVIYSKDGLIERMPPRAPTAQPICCSRQNPDCSSRLRPRA